MLARKVTAQERRAANRCDYRCVPHHVSPCCSHELPCRAILTAKHATNTKRPQDGQWKESRGRGAGPEGRPGTSTEPVGHEAPRDCEASGPRSLGGATMALRKRCSRDEPSLLKDGSPNPLHCATSPRCEHHWHYDFQINRARYRGTTDTADKHTARDIEARERSRILEGKHGIRRQPDITFRAVRGDLPSRSCGPAQAKREAGPGDRQDAESRVWVADPPRDHGASDRAIQARTARGTLAGPRPEGGIETAQAGEVNRDLDTLKSILSKAVEWGKLIQSPAAGVKRLKVDNRRTRILTPDEQRRLLEAAPREASQELSCWRSSRARGSGSCWRSLGACRRGRPDVPGDEERQVEALSLSRRCQEPS